MTFAFSFMTLSRVSLGALALAAVSACTSNAPCEGLGPCPNPPEYVTLLDPLATETSGLAGVALNSAERSVATVSGTLNRADQQATIAGATGEINADRSAITLSTGGAITLARSGNQFSTRYIATPAVGDRTTGVIGEATLASDMPTLGSASYAGDTEVTIQDGINSYDLTGGATMTTNFATGAVTTNLTGLSGNRVAGFGNTEAVSNVASIAITGSTVAGNTYSGGTISITSDTLSPLSATPTTQMSGTFFGLRAAEAGGVFMVNDTAAGSLLVFGDVLTER